MRAKSLLAFGVGSQLAQSQSDGGVANDDLVAAATAVVEGYTVYLGWIATDADRDSRFDFWMATSVAGAPDADVLKALRVLEIRDPAVAGPLGARLYAAWDAARKRGEREWPTK